MCWRRDAWWQKGRLQNCQFGRLLAFRRASCLRPRLLQPFAPLGLYVPDLGGPLLLGAPASTVPLGLLGAAGTLEVLATAPAVSCTCP